MTTVNDVVFKQKEKHFIFCSKTKMLRKKGGKKKKGGKPVLMHLHFFQVLSSSAASSTITALSPGGALMQGGTQQAINRMCRAIFYYFLPKSALKSKLGGVLNFYWFFLGIILGFLFCRFVFIHSDSETHLNKILGFRTVLLLQIVVHC